MDFRYIAGVLSRFLLLVIMLVAIGDICYQVVSDNVDAVETADVESGSIQSSVSGNGVLVRNELPVYSDTGGVCLYSLADGKKAGAGAALAGIYENSAATAEAIEKIAEVDRELAVLEKSQQLGSSYTLSGAEKKIAELKVELALAAQSGQSERSASVTEELNVLLNIRELKSGRIKDFNSRVSALKLERSKLLSSLGEPIDTVESGKAGYFYSSCDGYEGIYNADNFTSAAYKEISELIKSEPEQLPQSIIGKIVVDYKWYICVPVSYDELSGFAEGKNYGVIFSCLEDTLPMKLERVVRGASQGGDDEKSYLLLSYETIPSGMVFSRIQKVEVIKKSYDGYKIPLSAIRYLSSFPGVYILHGTVVEFRRISILASDDAFAVVDAGFAPADGDFKSLKYYDRIIIRGEELYVGKIID